VKKLAVLLGILLLCGCDAAVELGAVGVVTLSGTMRDEIGEPVGGGSMIVQGGSFTYSRVVGADGKWRHDQNRYMDRFLLEYVPVGDEEILDWGCPDGVLCYTETQEEGAGKYVVMLDKSWVGDPTYTLGTILSRVAVPTLTPTATVGPPTPPTPVPTKEPTPSHIAQLFYVRAYDGQGNEFGVEGAAFTVELEEYGVWFGLTDIDGNFDLLTASRPGWWTVRVDMPDGVIVDKIMPSENLLLERPAGDLPCQPHVRYKIPASAKVASIGWRVCSPLPCSTPVPLGTATPPNGPTATPTQEYVVAAQVIGSDGKAWVRLRHDVEAESHQVSPDGIARFYAVPGTEYELSVDPGPGLGCGQFVSAPDFISYTTESCSVLFTMPGADQLVFHWELEPEPTPTATPSLSLDELLFMAQSQAALDNPGLDLRCGCWLYYGGVGSW